MIYKVILLSQADEDITRLLKAGEKKVILKIDKFIEELKIHPETGSGRPEKLKYELSGKWSREITEKHRMIYQIKEDIVIVEILSLYGHYGDK